MAGGAGNDVYAVDSGADVVTEAPGAGTDTVQATTTYTLPDNVENLVLAGNAAINGSGNGLANALTGNAGNNVLNGGAGVDTASYANAAAGVSVSLASSTAQDTLGAGSDTLIAIEALIGSAFNDRLTGNAGANTLVGGLGDDVLDGGAGIDTASFANAAAGVSVDLGVTGPQATFGAGIDTLVAVENLSGSRFDDTLTGNGLNNLLFGGLGNDVLNGAGGVDTASYGGAAFAVVVDLAAGTAGGGAGSDLLANVENLAGSSFADTLTGNSLNNVLDGGQGNDAIDGGAGVDTASYASATGGVSVTLAAPGVQQNTLGAGLDTLGNVENLTGSNLNDTLTGDAGANTLAGGLGNDVLDGAGGNDVLAGGPGADLLTGGSGIDFFYFNSVAGSDSITDFVSGTDRFRFSQAGMPIGDGDTAIEGGLVVSGPGGFTPGNELVILAGDIAGAIDAASAAAAIGAAGAAYAPGATVLFAVDDGLSSGIFRFVSAGADAVVSAEELTQIADLTGTPGTALADYVFVA
jgi:Ca2+-binding RTX toxin-like protein